MGSRFRVVVFRKYEDHGELVCDYASKDVRSDLHFMPAAGEVGKLGLDKLGQLGELVHGYLGGDPDGAETLAPDVVAFSREARMVEVWARPSAFKAEKLNGVVIRGYRYRWRATVESVLGEGD